MEKNNKKFSFIPKNKNKLYVLNKWDTSFFVFVAKLLFREFEIVELSAFGDGMEKLVHASRALEKHCYATICKFEKLKVVKTNEIEGNGSKTGTESVATTKGKTGKKGKKKKKEKIQLVIHLKRTPECMGKLAKCLAFTNWAFPKVECIEIKQKIAGSNRLSLPQTSFEVSQKVYENPYPLIMKPLKHFENRKGNLNKVVKYAWSWENDQKTFVEYSDDLNEIIDRSFLIYIENPANNIISLNLDIFTKPGSHEFNLVKMKVKDISKKRKESLQKVNGSWYHNGQVYEEKICQALESKIRSQQYKFQLYIKSYFLDFSTMTQTNKETNFNRNVQKIPRNTNYSQIVNRNREEETKSDVSSVFFKENISWFNYEKSDFKLSNLSSYDSEWKFVNTRFKATLFSNTVISIKRIENNELYSSYCETLARSVKLKIKNGKKSAETYERFLWHGTGKTDPHEIIDRRVACLSILYANESCMWGKGIYFAENASYSNTYSFKRDNSRFLLFCKVFVGEFVNLAPNKDLKEPPYMNIEKKIPYDSVQGSTGGSVIYIIYENNRNYPFYLVEYQ